jgi:hypothetical protein
MLNDRSRDWPDYAGYANKCARCNEYFGGPKRAHVCWPCKKLGEAEWNRMTPEEQHERMVENAKIANEIFKKHAEERKKHG